MGNLVCGAAGKNFFAALLHTAQGQLSRVSEQRAKLAVFASQQASRDSGLEAADRQLEQRQKTLETLCKLLEGLQKAHEELTNSAAKDAAPKFSANA